MRWFWQVFVVSFAVLACALMLLGLLTRHGAGPTAETRLACVQAGFTSAQCDFLIGRR